MPLIHQKFRDDLNNLEAAGEGDRKIGASPTKESGKQQGHTFSFGLLAEKVSRTIEAVEDGVRSLFKSIDPFHQPGEASNRVDKARSYINNPKGFIQKEISNVLNKLLYGNLGHKNPFKSENKTSSPVSTDFEDYTQGKGPMEQLDDASTTIRELLKQKVDTKEDIDNKLKLLGTWNGELDQIPRPENDSEREIFEGKCRELKDEIATQTAGLKSLKSLFPPSFEDRKNSFIEALKSAGFPDEDTGLFSKAENMASCGTAYRKISLKYHPDRNKTEEAKTNFQKLQNLWEEFKKD